MGHLLTEEKRLMKHVWRGYKVVSDETKAGRKKQRDYDSVEIDSMNRVYKKSQGKKGRVVNP